jgi:uncharacterized protein (TIGR00369 family)
MSEPASSAPADLKALSGLEQLRAAFFGGGYKRGIGRTLNFSAVEVEDGRVVFEGTPTEDHYNPIGTVHGGYAATLLDSALGCAVHSKLPAGVGYTTVDLNVTYVKALTAGSGPVRVEGKALHSGGRIATAEAKLWDKDGRLCATGVTTCLILRPRD